jgi:hypothetical protein
MRFSELPAAQKEEALAGCRETTGEIYEGLMCRERFERLMLNAFDTVLLLDGSRVSAFGVCHVGPRTEAGSGACYVKFGAVRSGASAQGSFERLLSSCEAYAATRSTSRLIAGINTSRYGAYTVMVGCGFCTDLMGVAMQKANAGGFNRPGIFWLDDWR